MGTEAQSWNVEFPSYMTNFDECQYNVAMCCFVQDRQANDNNGNCATPYDENCVDADPADNTDICYADAGRAPGSTVSKMALPGLMKIPTLLPCTRETTCFIFPCMTTFIREDMSATYPEPPCAPALNRLLSYQGPIVLKSHVTRRHSASGIRTTRLGSVLLRIQWISSSTHAKALMVITMTFMLTTKG